MAKLITRTQARRALPPCYYCERKTNPSHLLVEELRRFLTPRGKILARRRSGVCTKHQRKLGQSIKRARVIALI